MYTLMLYSLKVGACLAVFYLFFKLLLSRETFHRLNPGSWCWAAMVLSFVLPLCVITVYRELPAMPELPVTEEAATPRPRSRNPNLSRGIRRRRPLSLRSRRCVVMDARVGMRAYCT